MSSVRKMPHLMRSAAMAACLSQGLNQGKDASTVLGVSALNLRGGPDRSGWHDDHRDTSTGESSKHVEHKKQSKQKTKIQQLIEGILFSAYFVSFHLGRLLSPTFECSRDNRCVVSGILECYEILSECGMAIVTSVAPVVSSAADMLRSSIFQAYLICFVVCWVIAYFIVRLRRCSTSNQASAVNQVSTSGPSSALELSPASALTNPNTQEEQPKNQTQKPPEQTQQTQPPQNQQTEQPQTEETTNETTTQKPKPNTNDRCSCFDWWLPHHQEPVTQFPRTPDQSDKDSKPDQSQFSEWNRFRGRFPQEPPRFWKSNNKSSFKSAKNKFSPALWSKSKFPASKSVKSVPPAFSKEAAPKAAAADNQVTGGVILSAAVGGGVGAAAGQYAVSHLGPEAPVPPPEEASVEAPEEASEEEEEAPVESEDMTS